jgi:outer membrane biosynthesis protein TonB
MRDFFSKDRGVEMPRAGDGAGVQPGPGTEQMLGGRYPLAGRYVCPFCGAVNETMEGPCPNCTMSNTAETRKATKSRIGPWYVLQSRNPAAPGMKYETLLGFVRKGRVKARSIVRGPTTHQLWRFACQVKGLSREFGLCYSCGGSIEREAQLCPQCNRLQDPPAEPDVFVEGQGGATAESAATAAPAAGAPIVPLEESVREAPRAPIFKEIKLPPPLNFSAPAPPPTEVKPEPAKPPASVFDPSPVAPAAPAPVQPVAPAPAPVAPAPAPAPVSAVPAEAGRKRNPNEVILSARELAAAFQLDFDGPDSRNGRGATFDAGAPWADGGEGTLSARPLPRRRRKRRTGRVLLLFVLLSAGGLAAYLAVDANLRRRVFDSARAKYMALTGADLYPDLVRGGPQPASPAGAKDAPRPDAVRATVSGAVTTPGLAGRAVAPAASQPIEYPFTADATQPDAAPDAQPPVVRPPAPAPAAQPPSVEVSKAPQPAPASPSTRPAASQPAPPRQQVSPPRKAAALTLEEARRKSHDLFKQALEAEERADYAKAKALYEQIMSTLPREVWYQGTEANLKVVKQMLGEK